MHITLKAIGLLTLMATRLVAFDGHITVNRFSENKIVILAETVSLEESVFGQLVKESDYDDDRPFWIPPGKSTELDRKTVEDFFFVEHVVPRHQANLYERDSSPSEEAKIAAETNDAEEKAEIVESMEAHLTHKGLKEESETDFIVYFYSGRAKMKVIQSLKGGLKSGDEIEVTWDRIRMRIPCPPLRPVKGECGWVLNRSESGDGSYVLAHGFTDWDNAVEIAMDTKKRGGQDDADQPATAPEPKLEYDKETKLEAESRSQ